MIIIAVWQVGQTGVLMISDGAIAYRDWDIGSSCYRRERNALSPPTPGAGPLSGMHHAATLLASGLSKIAHFWDKSQLFCSGQLSVKSSVKLRFKLTKARRDQWAVMFLVEIGAGLADAS